MLTSLAPLGDSAVTIMHIVHIHNTVVSIVATHRLEDGLKHKYPKGAKEEIGQVIQDTTDLNNIKVCSCAVLKSLRFVMYAIFTHNIVCASVVSQAKVVRVCIYLILEPIIF